MLKGNETEIEDIKKFANSLGALHRLDTMLFPRLNGSRQPYKYRGELKQKQNSIPRQRLEVGENKLDTANSGSLFRCGAGRSQIAINPFGELKMCLMIDYPKYKVVTDCGINLEGAWNKFKDLLASIKRDENYKCDGCHLRPYCKWCPGRAWSQDRSFTSCDLEYKKRAEYSHRQYKIKSGELKLEPVQ